VQPAHVDNIFEWTGHQLGAAFHDALWTGLFLAIPASILLAGFMWSAFKSLRDGDYQHLPLYLAYALVMVWLIWPVRYEYGLSVYAEEEGDRAQPDTLAVRTVQVRVPRIVGWVAAIMDAVVDEVTGKIQLTLPSHVRDFTRLAALVERAQIQDPEAAQALKEFVHACYVQALALSENSRENSAAGKGKRPGPGAPAGAGVPIQDPEDLLFDPGLEDLYGQIQLGPDTSCATLRHQLLLVLDRNELSPSKHHQHVLRRLREIRTSRPQEGDDLETLYVKRLVKNTLAPPSLPRSQELGWATTSFRDLDVQPALGESEPENRPNWISRLLRGLARILTDVIADFGRYVFGYSVATHVVAFAPAFYGMVILIVLGFFPLVAVWALVPYKAMILVRYFKILAGVKLWPVFWTIIAGFHNSGAIQDVLAGAEHSGANSLFIAAAMYLLVPAISVGVVELSAGFGASALGTLSRHAATAAAAGVSAMALVFNRIASFASFAGRSVQAGLSAARAASAASGRRGRGGGGQGGGRRGNGGGGGGGGAGGSGYGRGARA